MHSLELTNIDKSRVYRPAMNAWSNDKQRFRPPGIRPIVPIESGRASLSQPLHLGLNTEFTVTPRTNVNTFSPGQNYDHYSVFGWLSEINFFMQNCCILNQISLKFILKGSFNDRPQCCQKTAWHRTDVKPLSDYVWA